MRFGVVTFPGSNCEQDAVYALNHLGFETGYVWHQDVDLSSYDALILPGGFSYGDYLRCGAVARFSPVMNEVIRFAQAGKPVMGICNGFQVLTEAHLLPGALIRNRGLKFLCKNVSLRVEEHVSPWIDLQPGTVVDIPISHNEGNYICDTETLKALQDGGQIVLRYCESDGTTAEAGSAPNGALDDIAGICNEAGNVFGLMPHPERVTDGISGSAVGSAFFTAVTTYALEVGDR